MQGVDGAADAREPQLQRILNLSMPVSVTLCEREMTVALLLNMSAGTIVEFGVPFDAELKVCVGNRVIAYGQAVKVGERYGLRISRIESIFNRIDAMSAHAD